MKRRRMAVLGLLSATMMGQGVALAGLGVAKYAGEFLGIGVGARALAMGGAYVAVSEDVTSGYWNPAGLARMNYAQLFYMHAEQFNSIVNYDFGSVGMPVGPRGTLAMSVLRLGVDDIPYTDLQDPTQDLSDFNRPYVSRLVSDSEWALYVSYAKQSRRNLMLGGNVKLINKSVGDNSAFGLGFDLGVQWYPNDRLRVGAVLRDATSTLISWDTGRKELLLPSVRYGIAYPIELPFIDAEIMPTVDIDTMFEGREFVSQFSFSRVSFDPRFGAEFSFKRIFFIRAGSDVGVFTAGAGFELPRLNIDYAFVGHDELGDSHRISLRLTLEEDRFARIHH